MIIDTDAGPVWVVVNPVNAEVLGLYIDRNKAEQKASLIEGAVIRESYYNL